MRAAVDRRAGVGLLLWVQALIVAAYGYAVLGYLFTDAASFPEHAPPGWSWPAVAVVGLGHLPAALCLLLAALALGSPTLRADRRRWRWLALATGAGALVLLTMVTPPGWELFDWYVS